MIDHLHVIQAVFLVLLFFKLNSFPMNPSSHKQDSDTQPPALACISCLTCVSQMTDILKSEFSITTHFLFLSFFLFLF